MKKRFLSMMLAAFMTITFVACGAKDEPVSNMENDKTETETTIKEEIDTTEKNSVEEDQAGVSGPGDEVPREEVSTQNDSDKRNEISFLPDGPKNPTYRKTYVVSDYEYNNLVNGSCTLDELESGYSSSVIVAEEKIEYTDQGYVATSTTDALVLGLSIDSVLTYNNRGEVVHATNTLFSSEYPNGMISYDADLVQDHFKGGFADNENYLDCIEVTSDGKIASVNGFYHELSREHACYLMCGNIAAIHEDDRTILYDPTTCDVYDVESRKNYTALANGTFEIINYNSDGKIESIYGCSGGLIEGKDTDGNSYTSIQDYIDYATTNNDIHQNAKWTYDKNGNLLMIEGKDGYILYVYE